MDLLQHDGQAVQHCGNEAGVDSHTNVAMRLVLAFTDIPLGKETVCASSDGFYGIIFIYYYGDVSNV